MNVYTERPHVIRWYGNGEEWEVVHPPACPTREWGEDAYELTCLSGFLESNEPEMFDSALDGQGPGLYVTVATSETPVAEPDNPAYQVRATPVAGAPL